MTQVQRKVKLLFHTQMAEEFREEFDRYPFGSYDGNDIDDLEVTDGQLLALTAIRTCYSPGKPFEIIAKEGVRYLKKKASDGGDGNDADRLVRMIQSSGHTSTFEGITFTFAVEGVSRALLAQLTRHRVGFSFSVQSQRYVKLGSDDRSGGFDYVVPEDCEPQENPNAHTIFTEFMRKVQETYDELRSFGITAEDARAVLPNAAACNLVLTVNLRALLDFYAKRKAGRGAQSEIAGLAEDLRKAVEAVEPWTTQLFEAV